MKSRELEIITNLLNKGGVIAYPTETVWGIGCRADNLEAIQKVYQIKKRDHSKPLLVLIDSIEQIKIYIPNLSKKEEELLNSSTPTTVIFDHINLLPDEIKGPKQSLAFRITQHEFCKEIIKAINIPLISTSANISGEAAAKTKKELSLKLCQKLDYVVESWEAGTSAKNNNIEQKPSRILKIEDGKTIVIRA